MNGEVDQVIGAGPVQLTRRAIKITDTAFISPPRTIPEPRIVLEHIDGTPDFFQIFTSVTLAAVSEVPVVGGFLSAIVSCFWPDDPGKPSPWDEVKEYVKSLCKELIEDEKVENLREELEGLERVLRAYSETSLGSPQKGQYLTTLLGQLEVLEPMFLASNAPQRTLSYFVNMGSIYIGALQDQALFFEQIYGVPDPDQTKHRDLIKAKTLEYTSHIASARQTALNWRLDKITRWNDDNNWFSPDYYYVKDDFDGWQFTFKNDEAGRNYSYDKRQDKVRDEYADSLDAFMGPAYLWKYFNPDNLDTPENTTIVMSFGLFGGKGGEDFNDDPLNLPITKIELWSGNRIDGLQVWYGPNTPGRWGGNGGNNHLTLQLQEGEWITRVIGTAGEAIDSIGFYTNKGNSIGGGIWNAGSPWVAEPAAGLDAKMLSISGRKGSTSIEGLKFLFKYTQPRSDL